MWTALGHCRRINVRCVLNWVERTLPDRFADLDDVYRVLCQCLLNILFRLSVSDIQGLLYPNALIVILQQLLCKKPTHKTLSTIRKHVPAEQSMTRSPIQDEAGTSTIASAGTKQASWRCSVKWSTVLSSSPACSNWVAPTGFRVSCRIAATSYRITNCLLPPSHT